MAYQCEICDKKSHAGRQHTHHAGVAGGQWKKRAPKTGRMFRPNLHWVTLRFAQGKLGVVRRVKACAKCIKRMKFDLKKSPVGPAVA